LATVEIADCFLSSASLAIFAYIFSNRPNRFFFLGTTGASVPEPENAGSGAGGGVAAIFSFIISIIRYLAYFYSSSTSFSAFFFISRCFFKYLPKNPVGSLLLSGSSAESAKA